MRHFDADLEADRGFARERGTRPAADGQLRYSPAIGFQSASPAGDPTASEERSMASQRPWRAALVAALLVTSGVACGSRAGNEPAQAPVAEAKPPEPAPAPTPEPASEAPPASGRLPSEILSVPDKAWVFSFEGSTGYEKAKTE